MTYTLPNDYYIDYHKLIMDNYSVIIEHVTKIYTTGKIKIKALDDITFRLKRGEFLAIVGPSGSGKSSLLNILGTIDTPSKGKIFIEGRSILRMTRNEIAKFRNKNLGFVFQSYNLITSLDAKTNVMLPLMTGSVPKNVREERAKSLLKELGLGTKLNMKPMQLSGGEQQRVAIARALVNSPSLILADEPTGNLDSKTGLGIIKLLHKISKESNVTIIMITHNMETTRYCDKIIKLRDGKAEKLKW
jgi:putative ABC transport system ATP-binding protein